MSWYMGADYPTNDLFPELPASPMEEPWPYALWRTDPQINNGYPYHELLPEVPPLGAFANAENLKYVRIPPTTISIGDHAFTHTKLIRVRISENCTYGDKTFPSGCEIKYY